MGIVKIKDDVPIFDMYGSLMTEFDGWAWHTHPPDAAGGDDRHTFPALAGGSCTGGTALLPRRGLLPGGFRCVQKL